MQEFSPVNGKILSGFKIY